MEIPDGLFDAGELIDIRMVCCSHVRDALRWSQTASVDGMTYFVFRDFDESRMRVSSLMLRVIGRSGTLQSLVRGHLYPWRMDAALT